MDLREKFIQLRKEKRYDEIIARCEKPETIDKIGEGEALYWKASALGGKGSVKEAYEIMQKLIEEYPDELKYPSYFVRLLYRNCYDFSIVKQVCDQALSKTHVENYKYYEDYFLIIKVYIELENNNPQAAMNILKKIADKDCGIYINRRYWSYTELVERATGQQVGQ